MDSVMEVLRQDRYTSVGQTKSARWRMLRRRTRLQRAALLPGAGPAPEIGCGCRPERCQPSMDEELWAKLPACSIAVALNQGNNSPGEGYPRFEDFRYFVGIHLDHEEVSLQRL